MKNNLILFLFFLFSRTLPGQTTTLVLQPDAACGKDAYLEDFEPNTNYGNHPDFLATAWTNGGAPVVVRSLIAFNLSGIPSGTTILNATLNLYHYNSTANIGHSIMSGPNDATLYRITTNWNESTVTWNTMPSITTMNSLFIPASTSTTENYTLNVTTLIQDMVNDPANSFGFLFKLNNESYYRSMLFASSDESDPTLHPKLTILIGDKGFVSDSCTVINENLSLPNIFSPNNDGVNDLVDFSMLNLSESTVTIYNRWGNKVFETDTFHTKWDGKNRNGIDCVEGVYYYTQQSNGVTFINYSRKGFIELVK
jgi:gliding motility-associated-like protein